MSSLVEVTPFPLAEAQPDIRAHDAPERRRETSLPALAWRSRWLLMLMMLVGGGAGWMILQRVAPCYTSMSRIFVERNLPRILDGEAQAVQSNSYLYTQAELIRSSSVLAAAGDAEENAGLESFRDVDNRVAFLKNCVKVSVGANDEIINIWAELPNAQDAAQIVNSVVDAYVTKYAEQRRNSAVEVLTILRNEKQRRDAELESRRKALDEFRTQHTELAVQFDRGNVVTQRFGKLSGELNNTEIELLQAKALFNRVKKMYETPSQRPYLLELAASETHSTADADLQRQVQDIEQVRASELVRWGEGHPRVKMLNESLADVRKRLEKKQKALVDSYVESLKQNFELLDQKRAELQGEYDRQFEAATEVSSQLVKLSSLEEAVARTEKMCDILDERIKEVNLTEEVGAMNVSILETAGASSTPSYPSRPKFLAAGIVLGGLCGLGLAWLRDLLDHRLRNVDEVAEILQLPVLGVLPHLGGAREPENIGRMVAHAPRSSIAEAVRTLRTALHFGLAGHDAKTIAITSPSPGDGKSTVASNLAIAMAQADQKVLLIDADLRKPTQHEIFDIPAEQGLASVLSNRRPVDEAIIRSGVDSLDLLLCGPLPSNPVELLNNGYFADLLEELKGRYDKIVIDSPPVMPVADARVIAAISDSTLLVLRAERSSRRYSQAARNELWRVRAKRLGVVVNGVPMRKQGSYGYGYGQSEYGGYGGYGHEDADQVADAAPRKKSRALPSPQASAGVEQA